jgi:hypothetical protein
MKQQIIQAVIAFYCLLIRLYPRHFRDEFAEEMTAVFSEAISEAAQTTGLNLLLFCWRELRDYPFSLLRQHWRNMEANPMSTTRKRIYYLLAFIILGIVWRMYFGLLWGYSPDSNFGLFTLLIAYLPFILALPTVIICWLLGTTVASVTGRINHNVWLAIGLLALVALFLPPSIFGDQAEVITLIVQFWVAIANIALLLYSGVTHYTGGQLAGETKSLNWLVNNTAVIPLALCLLLLLKVLHKWYWLLIWDSTYDPIDFLWMVFLMPAVLFASIFLSIALPDRIKWAGFSYLLLMPALIIGVFVLAQQVDFRQLTAQRAARVSQALENYYDQEGEYPPNLQRLIPRYILSLAEPVIMNGQAWCYDGGANYYRLGYVYREHWSDPRLSGRLHQMKGELPELGGLCEAEVAALQAQHPDYAYTYWTDNE